MDRHSSSNNTAFKHRGEAMTRVETFVAASFAFAITMLVISVDDIPTNFDEMLLAVKMIPSFAASCAIVFWIWHAHAVWSRRFGLEDGMTIFLSGTLVFLILIYIFPLRLMMQGLFWFVSGGYFPAEMAFTQEWHVRFMFAFYAIGFLCLSFNFVGLYRYALSKKGQLGLSLLECFDSETEAQIWMSAALICVLSLVFAIVLPMNFVSLSGFCYFLLFPCSTLLSVRRQKQRKALESDA